MKQNSPIPKVKNTLSVAKNDLNNGKNLKKESIGSYGESIAQGFFRGAIKRTSQLGNMLSVLTLQLTKGRYIGGLHPKGLDNLSSIRTQLNHAIETQNLEKVQLILNRFKQIDVAWHLPLAIDVGNIDIVTAIIEHHSAKPTDIENAVLKAKAYGYEEISEVLNSR